MKIHLMLPDNSALCGNPAKAVLGTPYAEHMTCHKCMAAYNRQKNMVIFEVAKELFSCLKNLRDFAETYGPSERASAIDWRGPIGAANKVIESSEKIINNYEAFFTKTHKNG